MGKYVAKVACGICSCGPGDPVVSTTAENSLSVHQIEPSLSKGIGLNTFSQTTAYGVKMQSGHIPQNTLTWGKWNSLNQVFKRVSVMRSEGILYSVGTNNLTPAVFTALSRPFRFSVR